MTIYRERLWASVGLYIATALVIPASLLVFWPINVGVGIGVAIALYAGCVGYLLLASPTIKVTDRDFIAAGAHLPLGFIGDINAYREPEATLQRGQKLDARAWLMIRGWVAPVVKIQNTDPNDPTPYWLVSTRHPEELESALTPVTKK